MPIQLRCLLFVAATVVMPAATAAADDGGYLPAPAEMSVVFLTGTARHALHQLQTEEQHLARRIQYDLAIDALTGLYQLHGCQWAKQSLLDLMAREDCPEILMGYSTDGRVQLRVESLDLQNPAYQDYTILLVTLTSNTSRTLFSNQDEPLHVKLADGSELVAEALAEDHPLQPYLGRLVASFDPPPVLHSGTAKTFKQLFAVEKLPPSAISAVSLVWGNYHLVVPYLQSEVNFERGAKD